MYEASNDEDFIPSTLKEKLEYLKTFAEEAHSLMEDESVPFVDGRTPKSMTLLNYLKENPNAKVSDVMLEMIYLSLVDVCFRILFIHD